MQDAPTAFDIYKNRDAETAGDVAKLMELKYFDVQFLYYAVAYTENGRVKYRLNENAERMSRFVKQCAERGLYPTEIRNRTTLKKVPSGQEQMVAGEVQQEFVQLLTQEYPVEFFRGLTALGGTENRNIAEARLKAEQEKLEYCYDTDRIQLFQGLVQMAFGQKVLDLRSLHLFREWSRRRMEVIEECTVCSWNQKKLFYGFRFRENRTWKSYCNADPMTAETRHYQTMVQGMVCTPMFRKEYWTDSCPDRKVPAWKAEFENDMNSIMDAEYLACLLEIRNMKNSVDAAKLAALTERMQKDGMQQAVRTLQYYTNRWSLQ